MHALYVSYVAHLLAGPAVCTWCCALGGILSAMTAAGRAGATPEISRRRKLTLTAAYMACMAADCGLVMGVRGPSLLLLVEQIRSDSSPAAELEALTAVGTSNAACSVGLMISGPIAGLLMDRAVHWHRLLAAGGALAAVGVLGLIVATTPLRLICTSFVTGIGIGMTQPTMAGLVRVWGDSVPPYMQALHAGFGIGMFISPLLVAAELQWLGSFHIACGAVAAMAAICGFLPLLLPSPADPVLASGGAHRQLPKSEEDGDRAEMEALGAPCAPGGAKTRDSIRQEWAVLLQAYCFIFLYVLCELSFGTWLPAYSSLLGLSTGAEAAMLGSFFFAVFTAGRMSGVCISRFLSPVDMVTADLLGAGLAMGCVLYLDGTDLLGLWVAAGTYGFSIATVVGSIQAMLVVGGVHMTGSRISFMGTFALAGDVTGQAIMSVVFTRLGPRMMMWAVAAVLSVAAAVFLNLRCKVLKLRRRGEQRR